jgi:hypothetical protein
MSVMRSKPAKFLPYVIASVSLLLVPFTRRLACHDILQTRQRQCHSV